MLVLSAFVGLVAASPATGRTVTMGSPLDAPTTHEGFCGDRNANPRPCTMFQSQFPGAALVVPADGVVVRWRLRGNSNSSGEANQFQLRVLRPLPSGELLAAGTSTPVVVSSPPPYYEDDEIRIFETQLPVRAGDRLGLTTGLGARAPQTGGFGSPAHPGAMISVIFGSMPDGTSGQPRENPLPTEVNFNADVEMTDPVPTSERPRVGRCTNLRRGTDRAETITGTVASDRILGLGGNDVIDGLAGDDCLSGGGGSDRLVGGTGNDELNGGSGNDRLVGGSGKNRYSSGEGNDSVSAANRRRETIDCGSGRRDKARVDRNDRVRRCERVVRSRRR